MKRILCLLIASLLVICGKSQSNYKDQEIKDNVSFFRKATVSLGIDTIISYTDINGTIRRKRIFNTMGTGVLFYFKYENSLIPCLITAKHVLKDSSDNWFPKSINVRLSSKDSLSIDSYYGIKFNLYGDQNLPVFFEHPDPNIDLAAFILVTDHPIDSLPAIIPYNYIADDKEIFEGKEVLVLGYPGAVGVDLLNRAVLRKGIVSWIPTDLKSTGSKFLIDCNIFPGNSGGPVFMPTNMTGNILTDTVFQTPKFCGIVTQRRFSSNFIENKNGQIILDSGGMPIHSLESIGIGVVISASKVREMLRLLELDFAKFMKESKIELKKQ